MEMLAHVLYSSTFSSIALVCIRSYIVDIICVGWNVTYAEELLQL